uniref:Putative secreted protein n=1 Tax=Anopheles marajoara TaxID=58244 RepID=A0A2M4CE05_9DIPT
MARITRPARTSFLTRCLCCAVRSGAICGPPSARPSPGARCGRCLSSCPSAVRVWCSTSGGKRAPKGQPGSTR